MGQLRALPRPPAGLNGIRKEGKRGDGKGKLEGKVGGRREVE